MTKKYINKKEVKGIVSKELMSGKTKSEILAELEEIYYEKDILTKIIAGTPNPELRKKLKPLNVILGTTAIAIVIFRFIAFGIDYVGSGLTLLTLLLGISIFNFEATSYRLISVICAVTFIRYFMNYGLNSYLLIDLILTALIVVLGFHLGSKLFPNYGILGPHKGSDGKPII